MRKALIMCGGYGTRLTPATTTVPKQFRPLTGHQTMIQMTAERLKPLVGENGLVVITLQNQEHWVKEQLPNVEIITEPAACNTAPAIGLAAIHANPNDIMMVIPTDQHIENEKALRVLLTRAAELAEHNDLIVTLGIKPTHPHTGYGYIERGDSIEDANDAFHVKRFVEKPPPSEAKSYTESEKYYWNAGVFVFRVGFFLDLLAICEPEMHRALMEIKKARDRTVATKEIFPRIKEISIDYAVMERKPEHLAVLHCENLGWSDIGDWTVLANLWGKDQDGNAHRGLTELADCRNVIAYNDDTRSRLFVAGLQDVLVIKSGDRLLVAPLKMAQALGKLAEAYSLDERMSICLDTPGICILRYDLETIVVLQKFVGKYVR